MTDQSSPAGDALRREESGSKGAFFLERDGVRHGTLTYSRTGPALVILDHTDVADVARGTGLGRKLVDAAVAWARETGTKILPLCPYAKSVFDKDPSLHDVLQP